MTVRPDASDAVGIKATVLLVDDDRVVRTMARRMLTTAGIQVHEAADGQAALATAAAESIDLVITDAVMSPMDGVTLVEQLRAQRPGLRVLYMSGYGLDALTRFPAIAADNFLAKPFTPEQLYAQVERALSDPTLR